jgi:16S rRNA (guanine1207-N2)-methyltransferase
MTAAAARTLVLPFEEGVLPMPPADRPWLFLNAAPLGGDWRDRLEAVQGFRPDYLALRDAGYAAVPGVEPKPFPGALILLGRHRGQNEGWFADALERVEPGGTIVVAGDKTAGIGSFRKRVEGLVTVIDRMSKHHAVVFWLKRPADLPREAVDTLRPSASRIDSRFETAPGMFSHAAIDRGSALLAGHLEGKVSGAVADFGAGWGYLAAECLRRSDGITHLDLYEADFAALEVARRNLAGKGAMPMEFHWIDLAREKVAARYDTIVMNPPFHTGRAATPALGLAFIAAAQAALKPGGMLLMVANWQLPYEAALTASFRSVRLLEEAEGFKVIEARR